MLHTPPAPSTSTCPSNRRLLALILLGIGVAACCVLYPQSPKFNLGVPKSPNGFSDDSWQQRIVLAIALGLSLWPASREILTQLFAAAFATLRRWRDGGSSWPSLFFSGPTLYVLAELRGRILLPIWHDENMYRLQTTFLAHFKLAMPALPLPAFFDVPYVYVTPVYAPIYFPGTALLHVPAAWLHLPYFITPLLIAGVILTLLYLIVAELIDGLAGLLAVALMISLVLFRWLALAEMSHAAGAMWGLVAIWCWLSWRRSVPGSCNHATFSLSWYSGRGEG